MKDNSGAEPPAEYFGVAIDKFTNRVKRIFNPTWDWEFAFHHVDPVTEHFRMERKDDWGIPKTPDSMTLEMVHHIETTIGQIYANRNYYEEDTDE